MGLVPLSEPTETVPDMQGAAHAALPPYEAQAQAENANRVISHEQEDRSGDESLREYVV
ncbi:hypothetical protein TWF481_002636 [Arthrobotrys musiformis]|uniref:Uncharacterized protein n=1 Tax=Arthrobotrys musiformis TaxID=47236 RepID=A0AAV9VSI0_9PEZI